MSQYRVYIIYKNTTDSINFSLETNSIYTIIRKL